LRPFRLGGATVRRATLHNQDGDRSQDIRIGDACSSSARADVIPEVVKGSSPTVRTEERKFQLPDHCPVCGSRGREKEGDPSAAA